jgi:hypothetical protein
MLGMADSSSFHGHCPQCGVERQLDDSRCWLCGWSRGVLGDASAAPLASARAVPLPLAPPRRAPPFQFSIGGALILTTVIAVCLGAFRVAPGLGLLLVIVAMLSAVPAAVRSSAAARPGPKKPSFWGSFAISAIAITVGIIAFGLSAFIGVWISCNMQQPSDDTTRTLIAILFYVLFFGSPIIGLSVAGICLWMTWPRNK